jgi:serine/threonine protein kinase
MLLQAEDPEQLGVYRLVRRLGEGGQGTVFLGEDPDGQKVAVKLLHAGSVGNPRARAYFARELASAQQVDPFCTARILTSDVEGETPYIVSEYIEGPSLREIVEVYGPREGSALDRLAIGTATALTAIHKAGIVHRDFKPGNVMMGPDGPRVIDFGIARPDQPAVTTGQALGSPSFMAPEQVRDGHAGPPADVFAWACTMVYAATGSPPFGDDSIGTVVARILNLEPDLGSLTGPLADLVTACLNKDPAKRPSARSVLLRLLRDEEPEPSLERTAQALRQGAAAAAPRERSILVNTLVGTVAALATAGLLVLVLLRFPGLGEKTPVVATTSEPLPTVTVTTTRDSLPEPSGTISAPPVELNIRWFDELGIKLPKGWTASYRSAGIWYITTGSGCTADADDCRGLVVLSPDGVKVAANGSLYDGSRPYFPEAEKSACRPFSKHIAGAVTRTGSGHGPVGAKVANTFTWRFACTTEDGKPVKQGFTQREWFLPASQYLIVTWFDDLPVADLLAKSAQWR